MVRLLLGPAAYHAAACMGNHALKPTIACHGLAEVRHPAAGRGVLAVPAKAHGSRLCFAVTHLESPGGQGEGQQHIRRFCADCREVQAAQVQPRTVLERSRVHEQELPCRCTDPIGMLLDKTRLMLMHGAADLAAARARQTGGGHGWRHELA